MICYSKITTEILPQLRVFGYGLLKDLHRRSDLFVIMSYNKKITVCENSKDIMYPIYIGRRWSHFNDNAVKRNKILLHLRIFLPLAIGV